MHYLSSLYWITTPLHVSGPFVAHHQEVVSVSVVNGICFTSKYLSVGLDPGPATVDLEVKQVPFATLYIRPPDDGPQMGLKHVEAW
jgi:hypothetical protein